MSSTSVSEIFLEKLDKFSLIFEFDLINGPILLKIKENIFLLRLSPSIFPIKKNK